MSLTFALMSWCNEPTAVVEVKAGTELFNDPTAPADEESAGLFVSSPEDARSSTSSASDEKVQTGESCCCD
jgi:hypothetical protein